MRTAFIVSLGVTGLLFLAFLPFSAPETAPYIDFLCYVAVILPLWTSLRKGNYQFVSLIAISLVLHMTKDACHLFDSCLSNYQAAKWDDVEAYFTIYAITHLMFVVAFKTMQVDIAIPVLVLISMVGVNLDIQALFVILIAAVCMVRAVTHLKRYYMQDLIGFVVTVTMCLVFYFMDSGRFFVIFYALAFGFANTVTKTVGDTHHFLMMIEVDKAGYEAYTTTSNNARVDL